MLKAVAAHFVMFGRERQAVMSDQREVVRRARRRPCSSKPSERLDPIYRIDFDGAADDAAALRAVVDQVASLDRRPRPADAPAVVLSRARRAAWATRRSRDG